MNSKLFVIALALIFFTQCKKDEKTEPTGPITPHSNRLKTIRIVYPRVAGGDYIINLTSIYNPSGQLIRVTQKDSVLNSGLWQVSDRIASEFTYTSFNKFDKIISGNQETQYVYDGSNKLMYEIQINSDFATLDTLKYSYHGSQTLATLKRDTSITKYFYSQNLDSIVDYNNNNVWSSKTIYAYSSKTDRSLEYTNTFFAVPYNQHERISQTGINKNLSPSMQSWKYARIYDPEGFPLMENTTYTETGKVVETRYFSYY